jgi:hypothetical protein
MSREKRLETNGENLTLQIEPVSFDTPREYVQRLLSKNRLVSVDLQLTPSERENAQKLAITKNIGKFEYRGSIDDNNLLSTLNHYLNTLGENPDDVIESIAHLIDRFARGSAGFFDSRLIWIESRSFTPNNYFDIPRWHTDAKFFNPHRPYKSVVAIKGPQTRFGVTTDLEKFIQLSILENKEEHGSEEDLRIRTQLDEIVKETGNPGEENATIFLVGGNDAIIHSEPKTDEQRLFVSVITGPEEEMNEWYRRMDKKKQRKILEAESKPQ